MKWFIAAVTMLMLAGCGVDWFPGSSSSTGSAPETFTFPTSPVSITQAAASGAGVESQSTVVTVSGSEVGGWPVTVTDTTPGANSKVNIAGAGFLVTPTAPGTILPNQTIQVEQTPSTVVGGQVITTVTVGTFPTTFITNTIANPTTDTISRPITDDVANPSTDTGARPTDTP